MKTCNSASSRSDGGVSGAPVSLPLLELELKRGKLRSPRDWRCMSLTLKALDNIVVTVVQSKRIERVDL